MSNSAPGRWPSIESKPQTHEDFAREEDVKASSERAFGFVFAAVFLIIGLLPLLHSGAVRLWSLGIAAAFLAIALAAPKALAPLNRLWMKFGLLLHAVVNPVVMAFLFFSTVTPIALIMRALGQDPLRLRLDPAAKTYWIDRTPPGPAPDTMPRQF
jgi:saxitoxin biosynthesis operon SxtJ-like protein